jgi:DNA polymerase delta subunit 1
MAGRVQLDLYRVIQREHKLSSYKLNAVALHFLKDRKEDVPYAAMAAMFAAEGAAGTEQRGQLAAYCQKDTLLPLRLAVELQSIVSLVEMARVTMVPVSQLLARGQQYKSFAQIFRAARE